MTPRLDDPAYTGPNRICRNWLWINVINFLLKSNLSVWFLGFKRLMLLNWFIPEFTCSSPTNAFQWHRFDIGLADNVDGCRTGIWISVNDRKPQMVSFSDEERLLCETRNMSYNPLVEFLSKLIFINFLSATLRMQISGLLRDPGEQDLDRDAKLLVITYYQSDNPRFGRSIRRMFTSWVIMQILLARRFLVEV